MTREEEIAELFRQGFDCGQVVLASAAERLGLDLDETYKLASGFGGGMFLGQTCGAIIGAIIAIGVKYGHYEPDSQDRKNQTMSNVLEFQQRFLEKYPSAVCRELLEYDVSKPDEMSIILEKGLLFSFCPKVVADAIDILEELL